MNLLIIGTTQSMSGDIRNQDGTVYDMTGKNLEFFVRDGGRVLLFKSSLAEPSDIAFPDAHLGQYVIYVRPMDTQAIPAGVYDYGLIVRNEQSEVVYVGGGSVQFSMIGGI